VNADVVDVVIVIGDVSDVGDARVADVHRLEIGSAYVVVGDIRFAVTQWEPAHTRAASADPGHQSRRVAGTYANRSGHPAPASGDESPTSVMERREAPLRIIDPGPAPRLDPCPMPIAIRRPSRVDLGWEPDAAIGAHHPPGTVLIEIFISD